LHSVRPCTAVCWREGSSWVVHVPELDRSATASRLSQVEGVARDLLHVYSSDDAASRRVVVDLRVHERTTELIAAAADLRDDPDRVSVEAVTLRRGLARRLAAEGFEVRDVAALLGLSYGRTLALLRDGHGHRPAPDGDRASRRRSARRPGASRPAGHQLPARGARAPRTDELLERTTEFVLEALDADEPSSWPSRAHARTAAGGRRPRRAGHLGRHGSGRRQPRAHPACPAGVRRAAPRATGAGRRRAGVGRSARVRSLSARCTRRC
jgi:hypothetical protein